jgi:tetratricopeptide (TPR) repeat protein
MKFIGKYSYIVIFLLFFKYSNAVVDTTQILENIKIINSLFETKVDSCKGIIVENIKLSKSIKFDKGTARLYLLLTQYYILKGKPDSATAILPELEKAAKQSNDISLNTSILLKIALLYSDIGDFKNAIKKAIEAQKLVEDTKNYRLIAKVNHDLGFIYSNKQLYGNALTYFKKGLEYAFLSKDTFSIANMYARIGGVYNETNIPDSGLYYNTKSLVFFEKIKMKRGIGVCYNNIAGSYELMKNYNKAIEYYAKALPIRKELGDEYAITIINYNLGVCYLHMKKYDLANQYLNNSLQRTKDEKDFPQLLETLKQLCVLNSETNDLNSYKKHADEYMQLKDSITAADNIKAISELQEKYESEKKEKNIAILKKENEKQEEVNKIERKNKFIILFCGIILVIFMSISGYILFKRYRITQKQKHIIELQKGEVEKQRDIIELKNKEIIDSIHYAKRIQQSLMPPEKYIEKYLNAK